MGFIAWFNTLIFGPHCDMGCGDRVFPKDTQWHRTERCTMVQRKAS